VRDVLWELHSHLLFGNSFDFMSLHLVIKTKFNNFLVDYIVIVLCIVLKHSGIACHNLELMLIILLLSALNKDVLQVMLGGCLQTS
jgi:hypothetical protein